MRYLAIDYGQKRTGLAICDPQQTVVSPLMVLEDPSSLLDEIMNIADDYQVEAFVIGLPLNMDGTEGPPSQKVRAFANQLTEKTGLSVVFQDERLSSFAAEQKLKETETPRDKKKKRLDALAAAEILQNFLDRKT